MCPDILTGDVGEELLITVGFRVENQAAFRPLLRILSVRFGSKKQPQLERHVEPRKGMSPVEFDTGDVMDSEL
jgi:hypothetical protein